MEGGAETAWYVYGAVPAAEASAAELSGVPGVGGSVPVLVAGEGEVAAIASRVPLAEFGDGVIDENLARPDWLGEQVEAHEAVLELALARMPVVPFRFGTIYRSEEHVRQALHELAFLSETLGRLRGTVELGVKGFVDPTRFDAARGGDDPADGSSGRAYLLRKQRERRLADERATFGLEIARESFERLAAAARDARLLPLQPAEVSGAAGEMFFNSAYLVETGREDAFRAELSSLESAYADQGVAFRLTGPWPPYNFVEPEAEPS